MIDVQDDVDLFVFIFYSFGIDVHIGRETADFIERYFVGNRFPVAEEGICGTEEYYREFKKELDRRVIEWYSARAGDDVANGTDMGCLMCKSCALWKFDESNHSKFILSL